MTGRQVPRPLEAQQQGLDPGLELARIERARDDVVRAGLEEADPLLDVVAAADAHDRDGRHRRRGPDLAADVDRGFGPGRDVEDDQLVLDGLGERLVRIVGQGDRVAGTGQDGGGRVARRGVGRRGAGWYWRARSLRVVDLRMSSRRSGAAP